MTNNPHICPIGLTDMEDPVLASDGHSYDRINILKWLEQKKISPITRKPITTVLIDNIALRSDNYKPYKRQKKYERSCCLLCF